MVRKKEDISNQLNINESIDNFKEIFDEYYKPLCSFSKKYVFELDVAEDIVQELFVKLWEQRNQIIFKDSIKSFLYKTVKNECINYLKHQNVKNKYKAHIENVSTESFFHDKLIEEEINQLIFNTIQSLSPRCRQVFELSRIEEKSICEIANELSISQNTVKNQLVKALKQIRITIEKYEIVLLLLIDFAAKYFILT